MLPDRVGGESIQETHAGKQHESHLHFSWIFQITYWSEDLKEKTRGRKIILEPLHQSQQDMKD